MSPHFENIIKKATSAQEIKQLEVIQTLWSGYGQILRYEIIGGQAKHTVIVKHVRFPNQNNHPRGWNTDVSHERKVKSYQVETDWYKHWNKDCTEGCRTPHCIALAQEGDEVLMVMEDLDDTGYAERRQSVDMDDIYICLSWLAHFHAKFTNRKPEGLWRSGTYWHLQTRPDELAELEDKSLKNAAEAIDEVLSAAKYTSLVHGDAKLANFCFGRDNDGQVKVAAVDFQYVGGGCGMKDVAYFIGSCLYEEDCEQYESSLLGYYFSELKAALAIYKPEVDADEMCVEWQGLYHFAWADFHRFLKGWSPGHWKINSYSEKITREVINQMKDISIK